MKGVTCAIIKQINKSEFDEVSFMILGTNRHAPRQIEIPIDNYADQLVWYMEKYLDKIKIDTESFSIKASKKAKIGLRWIVFPNDKEFERDYQRHRDDFGNKTWSIISHYTRCIMQLVGQLAECVIVDHCSNDGDINRVCINIAKFMPNIYKEYSEIDYEQYIAFSTSFKYIVYKDEISGNYLQYNVPDYNPNHTSKDIAWCKKENILSQLKVDLNQINYLENAKLQIKATLNCDNLNLEKYFLTPVLCFDFKDDFYKLKDKYPQNVVYSVRQLFPDMYAEMEKYYKILAAYAIGLIDHINITDIEVHKDYRLAQLFRTPIMGLEKEETLNNAGVIEMAETFGKPIIING